MNNNSNIVLHELSLKNDQDKEKIYNIWADSYEKYVKEINYEGPKSLVMVLNNYINGYNISVSDILDFGCGTGLLGEELKKNFKQTYNLDGIDISLKMIEKSKEKKIYNNLWNINIKETKFIKNKYDIIVSSGVFLEGHAPFNLINDLADMTKKKGLLFITIRQSYIDKNKESFNLNIINNKKIKLNNTIKINYLPGVLCNLIIATKL